MLGGTDIQASITLLLRQVEQASYFEKYQRWEEFLKRCQLDSDETYRIALQNFLQYFPFNEKYWIQYIGLTKPENYQLALQSNCKSYELWVNYLDYIRNTQIFEDKSKYRKQIQKAIIEIGADCRSGHLYLQFFEMINENNKYEFFKKVFIRALDNTEDFTKLFDKWISEQSEEQLNVLIVKQTRGRTKNLDFQQTKQFLKNQVYEIREKTLKYRQKRVKLEKMIKHYYFNGRKEEILEDTEIWRKLIEIQRENGVVENISYCYERMLMAQTHDIELWSEVIHYFLNETNKYAKVLSMFRFNRNFFLKFSTELYFEWCDLQERENANETRKMYLELEKQKKGVQIVLRHIQFEIREKKWDNAKNLYDSLIVQHQENPVNIDLLCYILVEYANYAAKYYKDLQYPKKLLKSYFDYLPYNHYLFTNYLDLMRNFQFKECYYDELMSVIMEGLRKARRVMNEQDFQTKVLRMIRQHLRTVLSSIYLIKMSERKLMQMQYDK